MLMSCGDTRELEGGTIRVFRPSVVRSSDPESSLRSLYSAHAGELYGYARHHLHDDGLAEEVVQETFVRAWRSADRYDTNKGSARTWLFAICRNVIIDATRRRAVRPLNATHEQTEREVAFDSNELDRSLETMQMEEAMRRLSDEHRQVLIETFYKGRSSADAAAVIGVPEGTVRSRQFYALKALRLTMEEMGWSDD